MSLDDLVNNYQKNIEEEINLWLKNKEHLYLPIRYIMNAGGKRLRPIITLLSAEAVGGKIKNVLNIAVAIEFLHTFTLIHDDIMDNSDERRGLKTIHKKWNESIAILAGDFLSGLSYKIILSNSNKKVIEILQIFTDVFLLVCKGQYEDLELAEKKVISMNDYLRMIKNKTASLLSASAEVGALAGGGKETEVNALKEFGLNLGMAFQIQDDLLDIKGDISKLGKPLYQDIFEGKKTFLYTKAIEIMDKPDRERLIELYNSKKKNEKLVNEIKKLYFKCGVIEEAEKEVLRYTNVAKKKLGTIKDSKAKDILLMLTDRITKRNY